MSENEYVYVMSNPSFETDILKIGYSKKHPYARANSLFTSGLPTPFKIEYVVVAENGLQLEKLIHNYINEFRVNDKREFFKITKDHLYQILSEELHLNVICDISILPANIPNQNSIIAQMVAIHERIENKLKTFVSKLKQSNTKFVLDDLFYTVSVVKDASNESNCLQRLYYDDKIDIGIIFRLQCLEREMSEHSKMLDNVLNNHDEIKSRLGGKQFRSDNIWFKNKLLETEAKIDNLYNKIAWSFVN